MIRIIKRLITCIAYNFKYTSKHIGRLQKWYHVIYRANLSMIFTYSTLKIIPLFYRTQMIDVLNILSFLPTCQFETVYNRLIFFSINETFNLNNKKRIVIVNSVTAFIRTNSVTVNVFRTSSSAGTTSLRCNCIQNSECPQQQEFIVCKKIKLCPHGIFNFVTMFVQQQNWAIIITEPL